MNAHINNLHTISSLCMLTVLSSYLIYGILSDYLPQTQYLLYIYQASSIVMACAGVNKGEQDCV